MQSKCESAGNAMLGNVDTSEFILRSQKSLASLIARNSIEWHLIPQPVPLVNVQAVPTGDNVGSIRHICTGITRDASTILSQLPAPLHIVAFTGFGRTGLSLFSGLTPVSLPSNCRLELLIESLCILQARAKLPLCCEKHCLANQCPKDHPLHLHLHPETFLARYLLLLAKFLCLSQQHGIDMMVFPHPDKARGGHIVFLDCEGGGNHNQSALPFVIGLAARLGSMLYVFERGCFTTNGLDTVMQIINMV